MPRTIISSTGNARVDAEACGGGGGGSGIACVSLFLPGALRCLPQPDRLRKKMFLQAREMCGKDRAL